MSRVIYHIDCNAFFASVEEVIDPELKKVPMAICGNPESRHGIILAKNELAKGFGVKTAETIWQAKEKCPGLVLRSPRGSLYVEYCERVNKIYEDYTDLVERFGIDESYLDVTGSLHLFGGHPIALANDIRRRVTRETGLTVSVGVSFNKIFAKVASDMKKPDAVTVLTPANYRDKLWPLPVSALMMVGRQTEKTLLSLGIKTIGDLARADTGMLSEIFGKAGEILHIYACGEDKDPVKPAGFEREVKSVGNGMTFRRDLTSTRDINTALTVLADKVAGRMRRHGVKCSTVSLSIRDKNLKTITRQKSAGAPTFLSTDLKRVSLDILKSSWRVGLPIRMLTITVSNLTGAGQTAEQLSLFDPENLYEAKIRRERLEKALDGIRSRYGRYSICPCSVIENDLGIHERQ